MGERLFIPSASGWVKFSSAEALNCSRLYDLWRGRCDLEVICYTLEEWERLKDRRAILLNAQREGIRLA